MAIASVLGMGAGGAAGGGGLEAGWSALSAKKQWRFSRKNSRHALRWRLHDLQAAGINPLLAVSGGLGVSAQPGPQMMTPAFSERALQAVRVGAEAELARERSSVARAEAVLRRAATSRELANADESRERASLLREEQRATRARAVLSELDQPAAENMAAVHTSAAGEGVAWLKALREVLAPIFGGVIVAPRGRGRGARRGGRRGPGSPGAQRNRSQRGRGVVPRRNVER